MRNVSAPFSLEDRTALVTGAGRGIGQAIALALGRAGAQLILAGRPGSSDGTRQQLQALGAEVRCIDIDLSDTAATQNFARTVAQEHDVDILVNNAGVIERGSSVDVTVESWGHVMSVNLHSPFILSQAFGERMIARGRGKIINVASLLAFQGGRTVATYAVSKHGILGLTRALANEWAQHGVQVNALAPGYIATDNTAALQADEARSSEILARIPSGRWGEAADLGGAAIFLASPASDYVTGHTLVVDGGWMSR
ncbi:SDR family oxidoreductase [Cryobacterium adonitolivorans]|uniref:SDR family oxidoreductase n=1 Tax=Cryobacterium adonitolivorans TaxID=1259189 RepID=A0A4R8W2B5_9MICO|nr:SDR family oxidoreductase [Cryobacterium adonitolivorans]TFC01147.1 SDR family oxidoreductase [Cryobacterium adonitolivorans]